MLRSGEWKLTFDMLGQGQLYNLYRDPGELENLFYEPDYAEIRSEMMAGLLMRVLQAQDPLPMPTKYEMKVDSHNYWASYSSSVGRAKRPSG
jgi:hypothetical protein